MTAAAAPLGGGERSIAEGGRRPRTASLPVEERRARLVRVVGLFPPPQCVTSRVSTAQANAATKKRGQKNRRRKSERSRGAAEAGRLDSSAYVVQATVLPGGEHTREDRAQPVLSSGTGIVVCKSP